jgi:hydroxypyruvate isomerase
VIFPNRRRVLQSAAAAAVAGGASPASAGEEPIRRNGRLKQSLVHWCYAPYWDVPTMCGIARRLGCASIELIDPKHFPTLKEHGLTCAIGGLNLGEGIPAFTRGFNNPKYREQVVRATIEAIDACAAFGTPSVIAFTGMREGIPDDVGAANCVEGFKEVVGHAERKGVTLCLEMLNSRDDSHPMKGHPGYQGDHTDYCIDIIKRVGSPRLKLLFDVYHVQIMDGDLIRRIRQHREFLGHVHTAGVPGRGELDERQEIAYRPVMQALVEVGYEGYVGQEFLPTGDPLVGLEQAVAVCDI